MVYITRIEHFNAAHNYLTRHGAGRKMRRYLVNAPMRTGMGIILSSMLPSKVNLNPDRFCPFDVKKLSIIVKEHVIDKLDHKNLNV
jgi:6-pyruvoyltetrahydropterin/6-carboxytetrahydropterin synthase